MARGACDQRCDVALGESDLPENLATAPCEDDTHVRQKYGLADALSYGSAQRLFDLAYLFRHGRLRDIEGRRHLCDLLEICQCD
jgi:hypothetical protein